MSRGFYVPCAPFLYLVPDSVAPPGMELQHQRPPGPFHYLINEQAKSLVALQELQNEVGALLEFRDLVMDTFPHLRTKLPMPMPTSSTTPPPAAPASLGARREWEPGIRVRRKLPPHKDNADIRRKTITSGDTSSAGSSAVQDSGFSTETSSSKEQCSSSVVQSPKEVTAATSNIDEAEDELWNLLDVIHRKGTKLREEVESLQEKLTQDEKEKLESLGGGEGLAFMGDLLDIKDGLLQDFKPGGSMRGADNVSVETFRSSKSKLPIHVDGDDELREVKFERDYLMDKVSEMEAETLAARAQACRLRDDLACAVDERRDLEEQLRTAVSQKTELNTRIHDLHVRFVPPDRPTTLVPGARKPLPSRQTSSSFATVQSRSNKTIGFKAIGIDALEDDSIEDRGPVVKEVAEKAVQCDDETRMKVRLGTLDGVLSNPTRLPRGVAPDRRKVAAILNEFSPVELQRHLLATTVVNQDLQQRLDTAVTSNANLVQQLDKSRDENDDLRFQLEEKSIELEGTKAQVRVLERLQKPPEEILQTSVESSADLIISPRKRPSKIPLGTKTYVAPKPPTVKPSKDSTTKKDSLNSYKGSMSRNSSLSQKNSLNGKSRETTTAKRDSLSKNSFPSSVSISRTSLTKRDTSIGSTGRKSLHRQLSARRGGSQNSVSRSEEDAAKGNQSCSSPDSLNINSKSSPWQDSSSSDYFDSINISTTTISQPLHSCTELHSVSEHPELDSCSDKNELHSCSDQREEYFNSSTRHEGMAELDSLELLMEPAKPRLVAKNVWVTAECFNELY